MGEKKHKKVKKFYKKPQLTKEGELKDITALIKSK